MNETTQDPISIEIEAAVEIFRDLNEYVVSLDRILSRIGSQDHDPNILVNYIVDRDVFRRIARMRTVFGSALEAVVGEDEVDRIGEESYFYTDPDS